jgi:hypothetical protein
MSEDLSDTGEKMNNEAADQFHVQRLAYQLWQKRGSPLGSPDEDWFHAEKELREERVEGLVVSALAMGPSEM